MFVRRAITTVTVVPLALWLINRGGLFYFIPLALIMSLATIEYATLLGALGWRLPLWLLLPSVLAQLVAGQWPDLNLFAPALVISFMAVVLYTLWGYERRITSSAPADWAAMIAGIFLLGWIGGHFFRLRRLDTMATQWTFLAMLSTWIADSAAYLIGSWKGRRKLAPRLSPNKTVEGYLAGVVLGTITAVIIALILALPWPLALLLGLLISAVSPLGDLGISLLKREAGVKDSGHMLPGHGGALDRIDSLLWSVTIAYYVVSFFK
jgi:phosphatidate cytidylyltransferase